MGLKDVSWSRMGSMREEEKQNAEKQALVNVKGAISTDKSRDIYESMLAGSKGFQIS